MTWQMPDGSQSRVEVGRTGAQRRQFTLQPAEVGDLPLDLGVAVVDEVGDDAARRLPGVAHAEHLAYDG